MPGRGVVPFVERLLGGEAGCGEEVICTGVGPIRPACQAEAVRVGEDRAPQRVGGFDRLGARAGWRPGDPGSNGLEASQPFHQRADEAQVLAHDLRVVEA